MRPRESRQGGIAVHIVREQRSRPAQASEGRLPLEEESTRGVKAVVEEDVDVADLGEQWPQAPSA
jgi:hypothetical protein